MGINYMFILLHVVIYLPITFDNLIFFILFLMSIDSEINIKLRYIYTLFNLEGKYSIKILCSDV